jgi:Zn-dependent peptidase ImmA (M78 family)/DNA-binding XRE family transcriptional regulator
MNGDRIKLARKRAGLSLRALAHKMNDTVTAQAIGKYERDEMTPSSGVLIKLTEALDVSLAYLMTPQAIELGDVEFRTKANTSARDRAKVETSVLEAVERYLQIERILELDSAQWNCPESMPERISNASQAEVLADKLRNAWELGFDPIPNMTELLEEKGIKVLLEDLPDKVSGFTCVVRRANHADVPVVVVNESVNLERRRLTLAHELAHRVIAVKHDDEPDLEKWCNRFAGAFLIPRSHLECEIGRKRNALGYQELIDLKRLYRVAASALLVRLEQVGVIHSSALQYAFRTFARGWRSEEPNPLEQSSDAQRFEKPHRFERLVYRALAEDMISSSKAAELLRQPVAQVELGLRGPAHAYHS